MIAIVIRYLGLGAASLIIVILAYQIRDWITADPDLREIGTFIIGSGTTILFLILQRESAPRPAGDQPERRPTIGESL